MLLLLKINEFLRNIDRKMGNPYNTIENTVFNWIIYFNLIENNLIYLYFLYFRLKNVILNYIMYLK